jgi:hypothetical protein
VAEHDVLRNGEDRDEHEVLMHHADACGHRVAGAGEPLHDTVEQDLALVGPIQAVQNVHEGGLASAVLSEKGVDLTGFDCQIDVVIGDQCTESLGDPAKFELHGS